MALKPTLLAAALILSATATPVLAGDAKPDFAAMKGWEKIDPARLNMQKSDRMLGLFDSLFAEYAYMEGNASAKIEIDAHAARNGYNVLITELGVADDSISALRLAASIKPGQGGWRTLNLWRQQQCARGDMKGKWTSKPCP